MCRGLAVAITLSLLLTGIACAHFFDPCKNRLLKRTPSPNGSLMLATYYRECPSRTITMATVEKPSNVPGLRGDVACYVMSWGGRYPIDAAWQANDRIAISTTERLEKADFQGSQESCSGISISYDVQFRNERQQAETPETLALLKTALSDVGACINSYYKAANPTNDPTALLATLIDRGEHRSALEMMMGYTRDAHCPLSAATHDAFAKLSASFDLKPGYLDELNPLVKR